MDALFALGNRGPAEDIRQRLSAPPGYSAVRAMLVKLEAKGFVRHYEEGVRYVYVPTTSRGNAQKKALQKLVRIFFSGSPSQAAAALLKHEHWSDDEIEALVPKSSASARREHHLRLDRGASIDQIVPGDETALIQASAEGHLGVVKLLVARGANVNLGVWVEQSYPRSEKEWRSPLSMARKGRHASVVEFLLTAGGHE
jgi:predicted transcriptional regulator